MTKMGFYFDQTACVGCRTCQVACKDKNDLPVGRLFRRVASYETGAFPQVRTFHVSMACNHCESPACVAGCPTGAMFLDTEDGTTQHDDSLCIGCQTCVKVCPYGAPQFAEELNIVRKCDACLTLRQAGEKPACVAACTYRALEFGPVDELAAAHPDAVRDIAVLPDSSMTDPCLLIAAKAAALEGAPAEFTM